MDTQTVLGLYENVERGEEAVQALNRLRSYRQALTLPLGDVRSLLEYQYAETQDTRKKLSQAVRALAD